MTIPADFTFRPLESADLQTFQAWLETPHVRRWWKPHWTDPIIAALSEETPFPAGTEPLVIALEGRDVGYVQVYDAMADGDYWHGEPDVTEKTRGVDFFIADPDLINKKIGREMIRAFTGHIFQETGADRIVSDPQRDNWPCIIAMKRAGYRDKGAIRYPGVNSMHLTIARTMFKG